MYRKYLQEAFSRGGNNKVFFERAAHRADRIKEIIMNDVRDIRKDPEACRGKRNFPIEYLSFDYIGIGKNHYIHGLQQKEISFTLELDEKRFRPFHHLVLKFTPGELVDILEAYPHCSGLSDEILAVKHQLRHISRENEAFTFETMAEYAFDHAQRGMAQARRRGGGSGPVPA